MSKTPGKITRFWQELRRRKVIKVAAMYAGTTFIIIDASANVLPRLGLPDWTVTFLIILLLVGFPISLILSWIFDLTPQGLEKTDRIEEDLKKEEVSQKTRRLFTLSNLIIAILLVVVCILLYPKLFNKDQFEDIRDEKGKISVAVMPFENLTGDSLNNVWQGGIQNLLISTLSNSNELQVRRYQTMSNILAQKKNVNHASVSPSLAGELARDLESKTYILGKIMRAGKRIRIIAQLVDANTEEIYKTYQADCTNEEAIFAVSDSLGTIIKNYLEIKKYSENIHSPGASSSVATNSPEAFGYYIHAYESLEKMDARTTLELLQKAIETDPDFIDAYVFLSLYLTSLQQYKQAEAVLDRAYVKRDQISVREKLFLDFLHAYHHETPYEEIMYLREILEMDEMNVNYWFFLGYAHLKLEQFEEAIASFDRVIEIQEQWGISNTYPQLSIWLGGALHKVGQHKRENEIYELGLQAGQLSGYILSQQSACALSRDDNERAAEYLQRYKAKRKSDGWSEALILNSIGYIYEEANRMEEAEKYKRRALALDPDDPQVLEGLAWHLIEYDINLEEGIALIEKALKLDPEAYNIVDTWGRGLYKSGRYEEALQALHQAKELRGLYDPLIMGHIKATEKALAEKY